MNPYKLRSFTFDGILDVAGLKLKKYLISAQGQSITPAINESALAFLKDGLPTLVRRHKDTHGLGYVIIHRGTMKTWLLAHWWAYEDVLLSTIASADPDETHFVSEDANQFHTCVWEHIVVNHERNAWVNNMMCEQPNGQGYLQDALPDGLH